MRWVCRVTLSKTLHFKQKCHVFSFSVFCFLLCFLLMAVGSFGITLLLQSRQMNRKIILLRRSSLFNQVDSRD